MFNSYKFSIFKNNEGVNQNCKRDALRDLIPFVQFKKREKHPWWSVAFSIEK